MSSKKQYYDMPELVGFQTMVILDPNGMTFDAGGAFGPDFYSNLDHHTVYSQLIFYSFSMEGFQYIQIFFEIFRFFFR